MKKRQLKGVYTMLRLATALLLTLLTSTVAAGPRVTPTATVPAAYIDAENTVGCITRSLSCGQTFSDQLQTTGCKTSDGTYLDQFTVSARQGEYLTIEMTAAFAPFVALLNTSGGFLAGAQELSSTTATLRNYLVPASTVYGVLAGGIRSGLTGAYTIKVTCSAAPTSTPGACDVTTPLAQGAVASGALSAGDCQYAGAFADNFSFQASAGDPVAVTLTPSFGPYVEAMQADAAAGVWRQSGLVSPLSLTYWPEVSGTHRLLVSSQQPGITGGYLVKVEPATVDACTTRRRSVRH